MRSTRYLLALCLIAALSWLPAVPASASPAIEVWKSATCQCCIAWVKHLEANGFAVKASNTGSAMLEKLRQQAGVPENLAGCHSGKVEGYVVEGHVPASDIKRLLAEKPDAVGLTVPGMPIGSPGMERGSPSSLTPSCSSKRTGAPKSSPATERAALNSPICLSRCGALLLLPPEVC